MKNNGITRRTFIKGGVAVALGTTASLGKLAKALSAENLGPIVRSCTLRVQPAGVDPSSVNIGRVVEEACLKAIGFDLKVLPADYPENVQKVVVERNYDVWNDKWTGLAIRIDPHLWIYKNHITNGSYNWMNYSNPKLDEVAELQQSAMDPNERRKYIFEAQKIIHEDQPENAPVFPDAGHAYRTDYLSDVVTILGEGPASFWTDINCRVLKGDGYTTTGVTYEMETTNPVKATSSVPFTMLRLVYDRLFRVAPSQKPEPWAAKSAKLLNPTTIDITIREDMLFHDGVPVTAEDVKFTFDYYKKWKAPYWLSDLEFLEVVETTGKYSLRFKLKKPYGPIFSSLFATAFILPKHIWKDIPEKEGLSDALEYSNPKPIGSGPFKFEYWERGAELKLTRFDKHFHPPKCKGIIRLNYGSPDAMAGAIESGECHRTRFIIPSPTVLENLAKVPNVNAKGYPNHGYYFLTYNCARAPFNDPLFRKALAHVIPKEFIRDVVLKGHAKIGGSIIAPVNEFWHNPEVKPFPHDVAKARQLLKDAGYGWNEEGKLHYPPDGPPAGPGAKVTSS